MSHTIGVYDVAYNIEPNQLPESTTVTLNVGGKIFMTKILTLSQYSTYFEALFSSRWFSCSSEIGSNDKTQDGTKDGNDSDIHIFLDKDPEPFQFLLNYMRDRYINFKELNGYLIKNIIMQAEYFGVESLLCYIKARTFAYLQILEMHSSPDLQLKDKFKQDLLDRSDEFLANGYDTTYKYLSLIDAFQFDILPQALHVSQDFAELERITIDCSGTLFDIDKTIAMKHSKYIFEKLEYKCGHLKPVEQKIVLNHDPKAFDYLIQYMRYNILALPRENEPFLFQRVLIIAAQLQMCDFLMLVKSRTMMNLERIRAPMGFDAVTHESQFSCIRVFTDTQRHYAAEFDRRFRDIESAFIRGILPKYFFQN